MPLSTSSTVTPFPTDSARLPPEQALDVLPTRAGRKLCVRHKQMANQNMNEKLQRSLDNLNPSERVAITQAWSLFSAASHGKRKIILEGILTMCCFSQLSHLSDSLVHIIRIDPFSLLPRETSLRILGYLDAFSLGRAAQVSKSWKALADDDLLWRRMCGQHIDRKCDKCGWGLPLLERKRLRVELKDRSPAGLLEHDHKHNGENGNSRLVTRDQVLSGQIDGHGSGPAGLKLCDSPAKYPLSTAGSGSGSQSLKRSTLDSPDKPGKKSRNSFNHELNDTKLINKILPRGARLTRPWKTVYCERLMVERNWRKGRCNTKVLKGHADSVMCLQYHTALTNPSYPVLITGSYDCTVRVWNLDTGEEKRVLRGHDRAIRALQFDQMLLFTGSMDGTVRMWNWRAGECLRVMDGHTDGVVALHYNGYLLASGSADSTIQIWNFRTGNKCILRGHEDWVNSVVLWDGRTSPSDTDPAALPSFTQAVSNRCSKAKSPILIPEEPAHPDVEPGQMLFSASDDMTIKLWDLKTETCIRTFEGHKAQIQSLKVLMVDMTEDDVAARDRRQERQSTPLSTSGFISASNYSPPGSQTADGPNTIALDNAPEGFNPIEHRGRSRQDICQPRIYVHSPDSKDAKSDQRERSQGREKKAILASGSLDGTVKLWNVETGHELSTLFGHIEGVWAVDIDALRLVSASHDRTIKVWDRESAQCVQTLVGHRGAVTSLQLSDDMIVTGSDDGDVMIWNFAPSANNTFNLHASPCIVSDVLPVPT
ncbi:uncharacterized protein L203_103093 [Cryptococcus depauperatus CBS 7841]|uniref:Uncharacterized protein n=1 Tax=Cryptococcus depauperatus CBS 7841 TaxID=1295531 RepID=A0A1E3IPJ8_9TREE|nr:F-box and WD-40 domain-containing protein MET30 [Cryptococcus depauperatus CBS 7841]